MAANYTATITTFAVGDNLDITRSVTVPSGTISQAWLTVRKTYTATSGLIAKRITTTDTAGSGYISNAGSSGTGTVKFYLLQEDTLRLNPLSEYVYDIQVKYTTDKIETVEIGTITAHPQITTESS